MADSSFLEKTWDAILSREPDRILVAFRGLSATDRDVVMDHLHRMTSEPGWHTEQVVSAHAALRALEQEK